MRVPRANLRLVAAVTAALFAGGLGVLWAAPPWHINSWRAHRLAAELARLPPEKTHDAFLELASLGDEGLAIAVAYLGAQEDLSTASLGALRRHIQRWEMLSTDQALARSQRLAGELAARVDSFPPWGRQGAAELAGRLLALAASQGETASAALVSDCRHILQAGAARQASAGLKPLSLGARYEPRIEASDSRSETLSFSPSPSRWMLDKAGDERHVANEQAPLLPMSAPSSLFDLAGIALD